MLREPPIQQKIEGVTWPQVWLLWFQSIVRTVVKSINDDGSIKPVSLADADAVNNSIYYSTTQSKLVYKDSGGVVNDLY